MPGSIQDARRAAMVLVLPDVTIQQASWRQSKNSYSSSNYSVIWKYRKGGTGYTSETRKMLIEEVDSEFSNGLLAFIVEEITLLQVHRTKVCKDV